MFGYYNAGQDCTAACRIYAGKKIYDKLVAELAAAAKTLKFNQPNDDENDIGPLISARQRSRVSSFVERALEAEAHLDRRRRQAGRRARLLLRTDRRRRRAAERRDRAA